jgi:N-acetyl-anhydromuramyl-L-alanine amidase AmpD
MTCFCFKWISDFLYFISESAVKVCKYWIKLYNIPLDNVVRHSDCSGDHVRGKGKGKVDPGSAFDWEAFQKTLSS